jgi:hypothetical protein
LIKIKIIPKNSLIVKIAKVGQSKGKQLAEYSNKRPNYFSFGSLIDFLLNYLKLSDQLTKLALQIFNPFFFNPLL